MSSRELFTLFSILDPPPPIFDPPSSILGCAEQSGQGWGISDRKNEISNSSTAESGFRIADFEF